MMVGYVLTFHKALFIDITNLYIDKHDGIPGYVEACALSFLHCDRHLKSLR